MSIPSNAAGAGNNSSAQNVFRIQFSQSLSANPTLESWDDSTFSTTAREQFTGTAGNGNIPYLSAVATTDSAPVANWKPVAPVAGGATINRLKGLTNFVNLSTIIPVAGGTVRYNLNFEVPFDATVPSTNTFGVLACRFSFSGATPSLTWQFNDVSAGGTEGAPQWTTITPGAAGNFIRPTDAGANSANLVITKPTSSVVDAAQVWVSNT
jgi:hypothetical protein